MNKITFLLGMLFLPLTGFCQWTQLGNTVDGLSLNKGQGIWGNAYDFFGYSVDVSANGRIMAVGAPTTSAITGPLKSYAQLFRLVDNEWMPIGDPIYGAQMPAGVTNVSSPNAGAVVSLSSDGSIVAVGEPYVTQVIEDELFYGGRVRLFQNVNDEWVQIGNDIFEKDWTFGAKMSLSSDGSIVAVSSYTANSYSGMVKVFKNISGEWTQIGATIQGEEANDYLGMDLSLSADGSVMAIGVSRIQWLDSPAREVRIYRYANNDWNLTESINEPTMKGFGHAVALSADGNRLVVGAPIFGNDWMPKGKIFLYDFLEGNWEEIAAIEGNNFGEYFGGSVAISSDGSMVAGASYIYISGQVMRTFHKAGSEWVQFGDDFEMGDGTAGHTSSIALSYDGSIIATGLPHSNSLMGSAIVYESCSSSSLLVEPTAGATICSGSTATLGASFSPAYYSAIVNWYPAQDATEPIFTGTAFTTPELLETTSYWTEAVSSTGCASERVEVVVAVSEKAAPVISFGYLEICTTETAVSPLLGEDFAYGGTFSATGGVYVDPVSGALDASSSVAGTYTIVYEIGEDPAACRAAGRSETEVVLKTCAIQRGISPNGDDKNDWFDLTGMDVKKLNIYNRYGKEVYSRANYIKEWGGEDKKGHKLPTGAYFYAIEKGTGENLTGWVYINRED